MEINLSIHKVRSIAEKRGDACAIYLLSFILIKQKFLIFKKGNARQKRGSVAPNDPTPPPPPRVRHCRVM